MDAEDLTQNPRIARLTRLRRELEQTRSADESLRTLQRGFADVGGFVASMLVSTRGLPPGQYRVVRLQMNDERQSDVFAPAQPEPGPVLSGGIVAAIVARLEPQLVQNVDWSGDPCFDGVLDGYWSVAALPVAGDRVPMNWVILLKKAPQRFTAAELEASVERSVLVGALLENQILAG